MSSPKATERITISVVGPHSGCGKSTFLVQLLRQIPGFGCLKVRPVHGRSSNPEEGRGGAGYYFIDQKDLRAPGEDTAAYLAAGAAQVEILRCRPEGLRTGLREAVARFPAGTPIWVESSSAVPILRPAAVILVVRPPIREVKPSTTAILSNVTDLVMNSTDGEGLASHAARELQRDFVELRPQCTWNINLRHEPLPMGLLRRIRAWTEIAPTQD